ncbi:MAG: hypothetical protein L6R35_004694 [Caloplaca aegaea]|nr:MAG: hypothetical protein L6R35_004694 [Caloplaca aegaea]
MTRKVINPPRAEISSGPKNCPTCGHHNPSSTINQDPLAAQVTDASPVRPGVNGEVAAEPFGGYPNRYNQQTSETPLSYQLDRYSRLELGTEYTEPTIMGLAYNVYLNSDKIFGCKNCKTHLASHDAIISRNFRGQHGKAFLFNTVVNTTQSEAVERNMTTGRHQVRDVICKQCKETVGWKYDKAYEASEKYKEGKFILEAELLCQVY